MFSIKLLFSRFTLFIDSKIGLSEMTLTMKMDSSFTSWLFFKKVLDTFNTDVFVATNNRHMMNIIESNNGKELYRKDGMNYYVIPKGN